MVKAVSSHCRGTGWSLVREQILHVSQHDKNKSLLIINAGGCGGKGSLRGWWKCKSVKPLLGKHYVGSLKTKNRVVHSWAVFRGKSNLKKYKHLNVHSSTIYTSQYLEATQTLITNEWIKKVSSGLRAVECQAGCVYVILQGGAQLRCTTEGQCWAGPCQQSDPAKETLQQQVERTKICCG